MIKKNDLEIFSKCCKLLGLNVVGELEEHFVQGLHDILVNAAQPKIKFLMRFTT
jgi:hypothetical protein